jgi:hypothetical protein
MSSNYLEPIYMALEELRMAVNRDEGPVDPVKTIGKDATATFDNSGSNPTERASSEALSSATDVEGEGDPVSKLSADPKPAI